jgi:hypothetical protein
MREIYRCFPAVSIVLINKTMHLRGFSHCAQDDTTKVRTRLRGSPENRLFLLTQVQGLAPAATMIIRRVPIAYASPSNPPNTAVTCSPTRSRMRVISVSV